MNANEASDRLLFEKKRREAIEKLSAMTWDDDPHFIIAIGNHDNSKIEIFSCTEWCADRCLEIALELQRKAAGVTLDEGT